MSSHLLRGPGGSTVALSVEDENGSRRTIKLTRNSLNRDGTPFHYRIIHWLMIDPVLVTRDLSDGILYARISRFDDELLVDGFFSLIDSLDASRVKEMLFLRFYGHELPKSQIEGFLSYLRSQSPPENSSK